MSYRVTFTGPTTPDINHLLTAIAHRLNGHVSAAMAAEDPPARATEFAVKKCANGQLPPCPDNNPHGPWLLVSQNPVFFFGAMLLAFAAGFAVARMVGRGKPQER